MSPGNDGPGEIPLLSDRMKTAFEFARDSTKQLLTLATAILTITITLTTASAEAVPDKAKAPLGVMWILFLASIMFGAWTLLALTGTLGYQAPETAQGSTDGTTGQPSPDEAAEVEPQLDLEPSIYGCNIQLPAVLQVLTFLAGTIAAVVTGFVAL